jgi:small subunit ribosomal protein S6
MALYEHVFLARQDVSAQQVETMTEQFKGIIEAAGGTISKIEYWGVKSLAYRIKKNRKAHFALLNISSPAAGVAEMERQMKINEDVVRFMTIKVEALEEGPSAMMQRREREERRDRERDGGGGGGGGGGRDRDGGGGYGYEPPAEDA